MQNPCHQTSVNHKGCQKKIEKNAQASPTPCTHNTRPPNHSCQSWHHTFCWGKRSCLQGRRSRAPVPSTSSTIFRSVGVTEKRDRHYRFHKVARTFRIGEYRRAQRGPVPVQARHAQTRRGAQRGEFGVGRELRREVRPRRQGGRRRRCAPGGVPRRGQTARGLVGHGLGSARHTLLEGVR